MVLHTWTLKSLGRKNPNVSFLLQWNVYLWSQQKAYFLKTNDLFKNLSWNWPFFLRPSLRSQKQELPDPPRTLPARVKFTNILYLLPCKASFSLFWPFPLLTDPTGLPALFPPESLQSSPSHPEASLQKAGGWGVGSGITWDQGT